MARSRGALVGSVASVVIAVLLMPLQVTSYKFASQFALIFHSIASMIPQMAFYSNNLAGLPTCADGLGHLGVGGNIIGMGSTLG